jgi:hypothetical protein
MRRQRFYPHLLSSRSGAPRSIEQFALYVSGMPNGFSRWRRNTNHMICPVCAYEYLPDDAMNHGICPSCGTEFGYDDVTVSHEDLRAEWLRKGGPWFDDSTPHRANWDPWTQVMEAFYRPILRSQYGSASDQMSKVTVTKSIPGLSTKLLAA